MKINLLDRNLTKADNPHILDGNLVLSSKTLNLEIRATVYKQLFGKFIKWCYNYNPQRFNQYLVSSKNFMKKDQYRYTTRKIKDSYIDSMKYFNITDELYYYCHYSKFQILENAKDVFKALFNANDFIFEVINEHDSEIDYFEEGGIVKVHTNRYERNTQARTACLKHYGYSCQICGFDFERTYGAVGRGFIEVHHIIPLSDIRANYVVNPISDLLPVCSNCHQMLHRTTKDGKIVSIKTLSSLFKK